MSVLIKGMEKPKCCDDCPLGSWSDASYFHCALMEFEYIMLHGEILEDCPLVSVPTPHGRLIDADALEKRMLDREVELNDDRALWESSAVEVALDMFAPTVIEAEVEE